MTLEPPRGFEPRTYALRVRCSTPELRRRAPVGAAECYRAGVESLTTTDLKAGVKDSRSWIRSTSTLASG